MIAGLTAASGRPEVARAALEGIAWRVADVFEAVAERVDVKTLRVDGGLTNDPLLVSLQADAIGVPVEQVTADATSLGAALLAGVGAGVFPSIAEAAQLVPVAKRVLPAARRGVAVGGPRAVADVRRARRRALGAAILPGAPGRSAVW